MKILVLGGTRFMGRHIVQAELAQGHELTLFNRGQSGPVPPGVAHRVGDRRTDLSVPASGTWDAVVDTCGYLPAEVAASADALQGRVGRCLFISSVSVYASAVQPNHEGSALVTIGDTYTTEVDGRTYGPLKALCETEVRRRFGDAALVLRPGLVVGLYDPIQRFTYWPVRRARPRWVTCWRPARWPRESRPRCPGTRWSGCKRRAWRLGPTCHWPCRRMTNTGTSWRTTPARPWRRVCTFVPWPTR